MVEKDNCHNYSNLVMSFFLRIFNIFTLNFEKKICAMFQCTALFRFSTGEETSSVSVHPPGGISDGQWHSVEVKYYNR